MRSARGRATCALAVLLPILASACTSVAVVEQGPATGSAVSRGCRFRVGVVDVTSMTITGDEDWNDERNATDRAEVEARLRAGAVEALRSLGLRSGLIEATELPAADMVVLSVDALALDRSSAVNRLGRSSLACRFTLQRGPEARPGASFLITSRGQVGPPELVERHCALVLEQFTERIRQLLDGP